MVFKDIIHEHKSDLALIALLTCMDLYLTFQKSWSIGHLISKNWLLGI